MNIVEFLSDLSARGVTLSAESNGGQLRYKGRKDAVSPHLIELLKQNKSDLVAWLREREAVRGGDLNTYPLSQGQLGLWLDWRLDPQDSRYHLLTVDRLPADVSIPKLRQAAQLLVDHHPILRTVYPGAVDRADGPPMQRVMASQEVAFQVVDGSKWSPAEVDAWIEQAANVPFDLCAGPVMRMAVLRKSGSAGSIEHLLHWTIHHIATDFVTRQILREDLANCYTALRQGEPAESAIPADGELTFHDFVRWEESALGAGRDQLQTFWNSYLETGFTGLELSVGVLDPVPGAGVARRQSDSSAFRLAPELAEGVRTLAREQQATLYAVLLAAYKVLIHRYTGQDDFLIASPTSIRALPGWSNTAGYFVNPVLLRAQVGQDTSFSDLVRRTQSAYSSVLQHQIYPYPEMIRDLQKHAPGVDLSSQAAAFVLISSRQQGDSAGVLEPVVSRQLGMPQALALTLFEDAGELNGIITYRTDHFSNAAIHRMAGHFQTLLAGVVADPTQPVSSLPLLTSNERRQILVEWNDTVRPFAGEKCFHTLFEEQVERTPGAAAVVFEGQSWTYAELNGRANQIAHRLRDLGVGPDTLVGICVERSREMIAGLLGILKSGGAFLPLDPGYPKDRLSFMLKESAVPVLVTQEHLLADLPLNELGFKPAVVCLDGGSTESDKYPETNPAARAQMGHLAYGMYTSGSTGKPKGVLVEHRAWSNLAQAQMKIFDVNPSDRVLQFASISFDAALFEISVALCAGAALYLGTAETLTPGQPLERFVQEHGITFLWLTPSVLRAMPAGASGRLRALRVVTVGGEVCSASLVREWVTGRRFVNLFGPTETTIYATTSDCDASMDAPPIGRPIDNVQVYVLDAYGQPVPIGVAGQLWIGGDCLARGYLNQPELTEERFLPNPFGPGRLYRTGDLVRTLPDGTIEFIRRLDEQVKIRGFRIELAEIESVLRSHPAVREAAVLAHATDEEDQRLAAYVVASKDASIDSTELSAYLRTKLPGYMIPGSLSILKHLPLTSSGKLDRKALAAFEAPAGSSNSTFAPPRTETERALSAIWCAVLGLQKVGIHESFFELGGHSLLGTRVVSRVRETFECDIPLRTLFEAPTIAELAARLEQSTAGRDPMRIAVADRRTPLPLSHAQERLWFLDQLNTGRNVYNVLEVLRLRGDLNSAVLERSLQEVVNRHESLRTTFPAAGGHAVQCIQPLTLPLSRIDLSALSAEQRLMEIKRLVAAEANHVFDLARGPLIRVSLIRVTEAGASGPEYLLILNLHHIVTDGWSMQVFKSDLAAIYAGFSQGQNSPLEPLVLQYADFAVWQRDWLASGVITDQLAYWKERLAGAPPLLTLPSDRPRPAVQSHNGAHCFFTLPAGLYASLRALSAGGNATLFMTLVAAFKVLLMRYSGQTDIFLGTAVANRNHRAIEPLIGFFVNTLILRSDLSGGDLSFLDLLARVKETTLEAYRRQDAPFGKLVEHLQPERNLSHTPLFSVMFDLSTSTFGDLNFPGVAVESVVDMEFPFSKFDLTLSFLEDAQPGVEPRLVGRIEYATVLFDRTTVERMAEQFQTLLDAIVRNPKQSIRTLPLLGEAERRRILAHSNPASTGPVEEKCFHHLFEEQVERTPNAPAVVFDPGEGADPATLTYLSLNQRANRLAGYLRSIGVGSTLGPETLVALFLGRSQEMIVALLAILKAGGAYVPIDPAYPADRLAFMLSDCQAPLILTERKFAATLPSSKTQLICLDEINVDDQSTANPNAPVTAGNLAYMIYTSGSTGRPKGVLIEHRGLVNTSNAQVQAFGVGPTDRHLMFFSLSFDGCTADIVLALRVGAAVYLAPQEEIMPGEPLHQFLRKHSISTLIITPSSLAPVPGGDLPALRLVIVAGELCSAELVSRWGENRTFLNLYGATEASIFSTVKICANDGQAPSVGRAALNNLVYVLDGHMQPVPLGVPGEIYIGGIGVARGYHNRPELNAFRFVENPFAPGRLYRTGDLGRYRSGADCDSPELEFLGRIDTQVKLRGFRIELDEISAVLNQHPGVQEAVVIVRTEENRPELLAAYVVTKPHAASNGIEAMSAKLRSFLQTRLPDYMIPGVFVMLERLPLTANGKVDRAALPAPIPPTRYVAPQRALERQIAAVWSAVLQVDRVGVHDNFFELGGHSLLAIQLQSQIRETTGVQAPITDLFRYPTVASFAAHIQTGTKPESVLPPDRARLVARRRIALTPAAEMPPVWE